MNKLMTQQIIILSAILFAIKAEGEDEEHH